MKDLQGHSIGYSFEQHQRQHHQASDDYDDDDSENFTQPPPQHPLLEQHFSIELELDQEEEEAPQRQLRQENSISEADEEEEEEDEDEDADTMQEGQLFDCPLEYGRQQQSSNFINYCKQNNNPHQSINKPTDGTGSSNKSNSSSSSSSIRSSSNNNTNIIRYLAAAEPGHEDYEPDYDCDHHHEQLFHIDGSSPSRPIGGADSASCSPPSSISSSASGRLHKPASSPIQVPARRARRGLHSMKLNMMKVEEEAAAAAAAVLAASSANIATTDESTNSSTGASNDSDDFSPVRRGDRNRPAILENMPAFDDDDAFLEREFNENHYNHYLVDGFDDEHLTAEEDPMRLFASIQALAKSLHEDAELFGSLPPKRMLESPVRSMAYAR